MSNSMEARPLTSAFESPTFGEDSTFHVEQPVGSMSISPCGRDVVLASKEGLHIIDLDSPYSPPRYLPHHTPWEVADVQWSPFAARDYWVVSTSNQKALVWNLAMNTSQNSIEHVLHAHSRAITDINFSAHHPDVIATCSVDSFVHSWDLRTPSRPAITFSDWFAGATQVKWNRQDPHVIASSHDRFLRIWDDRMGAIPIRSIEAHSTKIYGVDWNRVRPGALVTCSLDRTVKFWDYTAERDIPEKLIRTPFPVWRARNTPFGWGVLAMPQRGNSDLHLYSRRSGEEPGPTTDELPLVHSFPGHKGQVKEFLWRPRGGVVNETDHREFQLVSWGSDKELRLHRVQPDVLRRVGYEKGKSFIHNLNVTRSGAVYKTFRDGPEDLDGTCFGLSAGSQPRFPDGAGVNNTISMPYSRTWGGNVDSRVGMRGKTNIRTETNPIAWMRGVKIAGWDIETLGDEISHVGEKFTKVVFESVDVRQRKTTISLHGPWGTDSTSLFLKADIKFPVEYPRASIPVFNIQKTAAVTDQLAARLISDLKTIAESYLSRKRGCLEGAVRYLLGESTLEESIAWIQGETAETMKSPVNGGLGGDDSSDEDEVGLSHSQDLGMSSELLRPVNANVMVPVAKACGALWANDGRLVCFFPPKKDKSATMLETLGFKEMTRLSRSDKVFEGFGRLQTASPGPRITGTIASTDDGVSEYSDESDAESSSSSGSSDMLSSGLPARFPAPQTWRSAGSLGFHRPRSTDNSQRSIGGSGHIKPSEASQTVVSIHDLSGLLPAKRELASKYRICGKSVDVCAHNASVALDSGYHELAQIWGLVKLILLNQQSPGFQFGHGVFQRRPFRSTQKKDSAVNMSFDAPNPIQFLNGAAGKGLQWGNHPFGRSWLIPALFDHFERIGDVQMVAMLSCVLHESNSEGNLTRDQRGYGGSTPRHMEPLFSLDAPSETAAAQNKSQEAVTPVGSASKESHMLSAAQSSGRSSSETWRGTSPPYSTGTTPPATSRPGAISADRKHASQTVSIATSPDQQSQPRSSSGIGSVLASSLSRSFTFGPSSASPPTSAFGRRKQSPSGSPNASIAWPNGAFPAKAPANSTDHLMVPTALNSQTHSDAGSENTQAVPKQQVRLKVSMKNQGAFDNLGPSQDSFLDPKKDWLYRSYRTAYSRLLSIWGLPVQQSEVLKIGGVIESDSSYRRARASFSFPTLVRSDSESAEDNPENQGLEIQRHCSRCGHSLQMSIFSVPPSIEASAEAKPSEGTNVTCPNCRPKQSLPVSLPCVICGEVIEGMLIPCLNCGHVSCFICHQAWFSKTSSQSSEDKTTTTPGQEQEFRSCPSGCGCICSEHITVKIPVPWTSPTPNHSRERSLDRPRSGPADSSRLSNDLFPRDEQHEGDIEFWRASPFASLARGLGGGISRGFRKDDRRLRSKSTSSHSTLAFVPRRSAMNQVENT